MRDYGIINVVTGESWRVAEAPTVILHRLLDSGCPCGEGLSYTRESMLERIRIELLIRERGLRG